MTPQSADRDFTARALAALPPVEASPGLSAALLAGYDAFQARRREGWARRFSAMIWPGAPVWVPHSLLAASLAAGIAIGVALPSIVAERGGASPDEPPTLSLLGTETESL